MNDDDYVSSELYRLMPPRRRSDVREALEAGSVTGPDMREALDAAAGTTPEPVGADAVSWPAPGRQWPRRLGRALARVDTLTLIVTTMGVLVTAVGVVIAYLALVKS